MMKTVRLIIKGKVQGVFFRASAKKEADRLGVKGTVRNLEDGAVEIVAMGDEEGVGRLVEWAGKGPTSAVVDDIIIETVPTKEFKDFSIIK